MSYENSIGGNQESKVDPKDTPAGKYKYWAEELNNSMKARQPWWKKADKIVSGRLLSFLQGQNGSYDSGPRLLIQCMAHVVHMTAICMPG